MPSFLGMLLAALLATACTDDELYEPHTGTPPEGLPATIELQWDTEAQTHMTRAQLSDKDASTVNSLWVGVYEYKDEPGGELLYQTTLIPNTDFTDADGNSTADKVSRRLTIQANNLSGRRRIVAVANVNTNFGVSNDKGLCDVLGQEVGKAHLSRLSDMLEKADTWEKFRSISACLTDSADVKPVTANLVMAGIYKSKDTEHPKGKSWLDINENGYVDIQRGTNKLDGTIHLRRLLSYVRFNIIPDPDGSSLEDGSVIKDMSIEPLSWQVHNVPMLSYLHERKENASDNKEYFNELPDNYGTSDISYTFDKGKLDRADRTPLYLTGSKEQAEGVWFDFYQFENKRTGLESVKNYHDREKEFKKSDGTNTGIYESLCESETETANNYGSFVTIKLKMNYTITAKDGTVTNREAYPVYTIHLGYCEGDNEAEQARDFNTRRNSRYTYNVRLAGVDKIVVEASKEGDDPEKQPGAEGDVLDSENKIIPLDAHYCVWNVKLSNEMRKKLTYRVRAFYDNKKYEFNNEDINKIAAEKYPDINKDFAKQLIDWISFKPTSDENTVAKFIPHGQTGGVWTLTEFADLEKHPHDSGNSNVDDGKDMWYTVFFNEYAYALGTDGKTTGNGGEDGWEHWVDQPDRVLWLLIEKEAVSTDKESSYTKANYIFTQKSIQTYYSATNFTQKHTAIGMEHTNECFGQNFRWTWMKGKDDLNNNNGRWNTWQYASSQDSWDKVVNNNFLSNPQITEQFNYSNPTYYPAQTHPVRQQIQGSLRSNAQPDPQKNDLHYNEMIAACMNRNRDLNGDGTIDADELRWYVPTASQYLRMTLGAPSLRVPLMDYNATSDLYYGTVWSWNANNTRFHFFSSDMSYMWMEEGVSTSDIKSGENPSGHGSQPGWQVRCIRNLGTKLSDTPTTDDPTDHAYNVNENTCTVEMLYYDNTAIRAGMAATLPAHRINERANMVAPKFEYAKNFIEVTLDKGSPAANIEDWKNRLNNGNPCGTYNQGGDATGWRVPNQSELNIMFHAGIIQKDREYYLSCTQAFFDDRFMGISTNLSTALNMQNKTYRVRCVRDIISGTATAASRRKSAAAQSTRTARAAAQRQASAQRQAPVVRKQAPAAPDFTFTTREGSTSSLAAKKGRPVLLLFYDPDCDHCRDMVATLRNDPALAKILRDGKASVLAVDAEPDFEAWQRTAMHLPQEWTVAFDRSGILDKDLYRLDRMPTLYVIGGDGSIVLSDAEPAQALLKIKNLANRQ